jgi:hypothetical protein
MRRISLFQLLILICLAVISPLNAHAALAEISGGTASADTSANQSSTSITPDQTYSAGTTACILVIAVDNNQTTDGDEVAVTGVTDDATAPGNVWVKAREFTNGQGSSQAGATVSVWFSNISVAIGTGNSITAAFSNNTSRDKSAMSLKCYSYASGSSIRPDFSNELANDGADPGSLNTSTTNLSHIRLRAIASESNSSTALTVTAGGWAAISQAVSSGGGSASNMGVRGEWKISTATGDASDPTLFNADHASVYVAFEEIVFAIGLTQTLFRMYGDGTESGSTALAALNTNYTADISGGNVTVHIRFGLSTFWPKVSGYTTDDYQLYMSKNGGSYALAATEIIGFDSASLTDGGVTTERLAGSSTFSAGEVSEDHIVDDYALGCGPCDVGADSETELLYSVRIVAAAVTSGDTYDFRVRYNTAVFGTYTNTPRITITGTFSPGARRVFVISE